MENGSNLRTGVKDGTDEKGGTNETNGTGGHAVQI